MNRFLYTCAALLTAALTFAAVEGGLFLHDLRFHTLPVLEQNMKIIGGASTDIEKGLRAWKDQSVKQAAAATLATLTLNSDLSSFGTLLSTANATLAEQRTFLLSFETQIAPLLTSGRTFMEHAVSLSDSILESTKSLSIATGDVAATTTRTMPHVESILLNLDGTVANGNHISSNLNIESDLLVGATRKALAPDSKKVLLLKAIGGNIVTVLETLYYLRNGG